LKRPSKKFQKRSRKKEAAKRKRSCHFLEFIKRSRLIRQLILLERWIKYEQERFYQQSRISSLIHQECFQKKFR
jgi:hypothetical protein